MSSANSNERSRYKQQRNKGKLSGPMAIGFNSSKAFEGGNWRKKENGRYRKIGGATQQPVRAGDCWISEAA
jgi:hypothetical protein